MRNLKDFCLIQENSLSDKVCDELREFFYSNEDIHDHYRDNQRPQFTQLQFTNNRQRAPQLHSECEKAALNAIKTYKQKVPETSYWPDTYGFEVFRIKYYNNNGSDQFKPHVDAITTESMKRFMAFFWYLSDVEEGGETEFLNFDLKIKPKKGTLFMFPPLWLYPHKGNPTTVKDKFLLSSYLHFTE